MTRLLIFLAGMATALALLAATAFLGAKHVAAWTVVSAEPTKADAIVVLGGGDGSRLRKGLQLYDQGYSPRLILVDTKKEAWAYVARKLCTDCVLEGKNVTILDGSVSTRTDAELSLQHCRQNSLKSVLVVTSPYHTRRAKLVFDDIAADLRGQAPGGASPLAISVISTDDYGKLLPPNEEWWLDDRTLQTVWVEFGKSLYWRAPGVR